MQISLCIGFLLSVLAAAVGATPTADKESMLEKRTSYEEYLVLVGEYCYIFRTQAIDYCGGDNGCVCYACLDYAAGGLCGSDETCMDIMLNLCCCTDNPI
jgi:hypothetical protein